MHSFGAAPYYVMFPQATNKNKYIKELSYFERGHVM
jgi:hypothetical protein